MKQISRLVCAGLVAAVGLAAWRVSWAGGDSDAARQKATCTSNLKQLATGMMMYIQDYDERFPPAGKWSTVTQPYIKSTSVLKCPADSSPNSYAMNSNLSMASMADVRKPAETASLFESNKHIPSASGTVADVAKPPRHEGANNYAFTDGHVKAMTSPPSFGPDISRKPQSKPAKGKPRKKR